MTDQRVPPQDIEAEAALLAELIDNPAVAMRGVVETRLQPEHFYRHDFGAVFRAMLRATSEGKVADELATWATLEAMGLATPAEEGVSRETLGKLVGQSVNPYRAHDIAKRLIALSNERSSLDGARKIIESVHAPDEETKADLYQAGLELIAADFSVEAQPTSREEIASDFFDYLDREEAGEVFKLPFDDLNECVLGGYRRGQTTVLGGWTGMGKSWLLDQMLAGFFEQGHSTAIFATEMSRRERVARFITMQTGIAVEKLLLKRLTNEETAEAVKALQRIPFAYFEANGWSAEEICERIIFGGYDVAAVDVVNLIPGYEEVKKATRILGRFIEVARRADCHLILVSHLNRARADKAKLPRPVKRDLRDSGMLEANANAILFLHRDQDDEGHKLPTAEVYFDKVRNGMEGGLHVTHNQKFLTFQPGGKVDPAVEADLPGVFG